MPSLNLILAEIEANVEVTANLSRPVPLRLLIHHSIGDSMTVDISIQRHSNGYLTRVLRAGATTLAHDTVLAPPSVPPTLPPNLAVLDRAPDVWIWYNLTVVQPKVIFTTLLEHFVLICLVLISGSISSPEAGNWHLHWIWR